MPCAHKVVRDPRFQAVAVAAVVLAVYGLTLAAPPFYDDRFFVQGNPALSLPFGAFARGLLSRGYLPAMGERTYQPLVTLFHYLTHDCVWLYRLSGILLHALNGVLVTLYARRLLKDDVRALLAGLLFACFPPNTEAVAVSAFKGHPAAFACILAALLAWESQSPLVYAFFALGLLCKETALLIPLLAALRRRPRPVQWALFSAVAVPYVGLRFFILLPAPPTARLVPPGRASVLSFGWYVGRLLWPHPLCLESSFAPGWGLYPLLAAAYFAALAFTRSALLAWVGAGLLPFLHLIPFANHSPVADRYLYLPAAGFCLFLASLPRIRRTLLCVLLLAWGFSSMRRNALYLDPERLSLQTASCAPTNPRAQAMLGGFYADNRRDFARALSCFEKAFTLDPGYRTRIDDPGLVHIEGMPYVIGSLRLNLGDTRGAEALLTRGIAAGDGHPAALRIKRGDALLRMGREDAALRDYEDAVHADPSWFIPPLKTGLLLARRRDPAAVERLRMAAALGSGWARVDEALARALLVLGRVAEASERFRSAAQKEPWRAELWQELSDCLLLSGDRLAAQEAARRAASARTRN